MVIRVSSIAAAAVLTVVGIIGFSSSAHARTPQAPALKECPSGESISVTAPTVAAPTTVSVTVTPPVNLKPAKDADATSYHLHYFVDIDPATVAQAGQPVPTGNPNIIHSAATTQDLGALAAGKHTVWVVMGDVSHIVCNPVVQGTVSFDVAALPKTGTGAAGDDAIGGWALWLTVAAGAVIAAAGVALRRAAR
jgi:hypothetical protein